MSNSIVFTSSGIGPVSLVLSWSASPTSVAVSSEILVGCGVVIAKTGLFNRGPLIPSYSNGAFSSAGDYA